MSQDGYAIPIMNDEPEFHSIIPVSELTKRITRVIQVTLPTPTISLFTLNHFIHPYAHSFHTPAPPQMIRALNRPGAQELSIAHVAKCITTLRVAS